MALTDDQRAMLRLLAQNDESYEDIAALKGVSVEQVRSEVKAALAAAAADESAPPTRVEPPSGEVTPRPEEPARTTEPSPPPAPSSKGPAVPGKPGTRPPHTSMPPERRRLLAFAAGAVAVVAVVLIAFAVFGDSSGSSSSSTGGGSSASETAGAESGKLTQAELRPASGENGEGRAIFGRLGKKEIVLQVAAQGLTPNSKGESYTVWLYRSPKVVLRIGSVKVGQSGRLGVQLPIPAELLAYVAAGAFKQIYVSRTEDAAYEAAVARAKKQKSLPPYSGETVLTGEITGPIVKSASPGS
jgi:hypothetical protein